MRATTACASLILLVTFGGGCEENACEARPAEAQIDINLRRIPERALITEVGLVVNGGEPLTRVFASARSLSFAFSFGAQNRSPRTLEVSVRVLDDEGGEVATGSLATGFVGNGCNFFSVDVAGPDQDAGLGDGRVGDGGADLMPPPPDAGPTPDISTDATPDTGADAAVDAGADTVPPDVGFDAVGDAPLDATAG